MIGFQREEAEANRWKDVMAGNLGEWGKAEEKRDSDKRDLAQLVNIDGVQMLWPEKLLVDNMICYLNDIAWMCNLQLSLLLV